MKARWEDQQWRRSMRIRLDYSNLMADSVGSRNGIEQNDLEYCAGMCKNAHAELRKKRDAGELGFMALPHDQYHSDEIAALAGDLKKNFESFVVIGIGGSALGNIALQTALNPPYYNELPASVRNGMKVYFHDNIDPAFMKGLLDVLDVSKTVFNIITKSGSTAETLANFMVIRQALRDAVGGDRVNEHLVFTTDRDRGLLRKIAREEGVRSLEVPYNVGGRFSVLSSVGLLSAAAAGIDIHELLAGAAFMDSICSDDDIGKNPAYMNAALQYLMYQKGRHVSVLMPYAQCLRDIADWFRQLWAESLGKKVTRSGMLVNVGPTPVKALGATDQPSHIQLYIEGPFDKVITFITVGRFSEEVMMPPSYAEEDALGYLGNRTLNDLLHAEQRATEYALTKNERPNCKIILPEINPFTVGQLLYMLEIQTAAAGELFNINAFDQPGVEEGKTATYALMGRKGYEQQGRELEAGLEKQKPLIV